MTDNTELQRLTRLRRLSRQIAASLPMDLDLEQAFQVQAPRTPSSKAVLRAELETAMANYRGRVTLCPPAAPPKPDRSDDLELVDDDEVDEDAVTGR